MFRTSGLGVQIFLSHFIYAPLYTTPNISSHVDRRLLNTNGRLNGVNLKLPNSRSKPKTKKHRTTIKISNHNQFHHYGYLEKMMIVNLDSKEQSLQAWSKDLGEFGFLFCFLFFIYLLFFMGFWPRRQPWVEELS